MLHPIDIITRDDRLTGKISNPEEANNKGLWHRGVHVVIYTPEGDLLLQKRSSIVMMYPNKIEIGAGGFVDSHETPEQAAVREVKEETGLVINESELELVHTVRYNHRWHFKKHHKITRVVINTYLCRLDRPTKELVPQQSEVSWIQFVPLRSVQWLIRRHALKHLGALVSRYGYYRRIIVAVSKRLRG